jgi:hypothetical protein
VGWDLERARIGASREVPVQIVVNGAVAATQNLVADGAIRTLRFDIAIDRSSWIAARILPSSTPTRCLRSSAASRFARRAGASSGASPR